MKSYNYKKDGNKLGKRKLKLMLDKNLISEFEINLASGINSSEFCSFYGLAQPALVGFGASSFKHAVAMEAIEKNKVMTLQLEDKSDKCFVDDIPNKRIGEYGRHCMHDKFDNIINSLSFNVKKPYYKEVAIEDGEK